MVQSQVSSRGRSSSYSSSHRGGGEGDNSDDVRRGGEIIRRQILEQQFPSLLTPEGEEDSLQNSQDDVGSVGLHDPAFGGGSEGRSRAGTTVKRRNGSGGGASAALWDLRAESDDILRDVEGNGNVLQWSAATRNGAALTLVGYNWELGRGAMSRWWAGWVAERADGRCDFPLVLVLLSCLRKMAICRVERGCERKSSRSG